MFQYIYCVSQYILPEFRHLINIDRNIINESLDIFDDIFSIPIKIQCISYYIASIIKNDIVRKNEINELINGFNEYFKTKPKNHLNKELLNKIINRFDESYNKSLYHAGTNIGVLASTSISESATQNVLNTFHYSGTTSGQQCSMSVGMPRILELLALTKEQKTVNLSFSIKKDLIDTNDILKIYKTAYSFEYKILSNFITSYNIINIKNYIESLGESNWINIYLNMVCGVNGILKYNSKKINRESFKDNIFEYGLLLKIDTQKLYKYSKTMIDVCDSINSEYQDIFCACSPDIYKTILVYVINPNFGLSDNLNNSLNMYFDFLLKKLNEIYICGIYNIDKVFIKPNKQIETNGGSLINTMINENINSNTVLSNNINDVYNVLGIEAARQMLINELKTSFSHSGIVTNEQHVELLADVMSTSGVLKPVNRYGLDNDSVISTACFEQSLNILLNAAIDGRVDNIKSSSSNIICGNMVKSGTGYFDLFLKM
jgi:DNA-directed RNA polymerase II subunit RPB1